MVAWIIERAKEKSTWAGIVGVIAATGAVSFSPDQKEAILTAIAGIVSAVCIFTETKK